MSRVSTATFHLIPTSQSFMPCLHLTEAWTFFLFATTFQLICSPWCSHIYLESWCWPAVPLHRTGRSRGRAAVWWCWSAAWDEHFLPAHKTTHKSQAEFLILGKKDLDLPTNMSIWATRFISKHDCHCSSENKKWSSNTNTKSWTTCT